MTLDVIIATYGTDGIERLRRVSLPKLINVGYIIGWQNHGGGRIPDELIREDITVLRINEKGLSRNRNLAIAHSNADVVLISDDDVTLYPHGIVELMKIYQEEPLMDVITFRTVSAYSPVYPSESKILGFYLPKNYYIRSIDLSFRRKVSEKVKFHTSFGINSGIFEACEDELFHLQCRRKKINCIFVPITVGEHPGLSTGITKTHDRKVLTSMGFVITKSYPFGFPLRLLLKAWRLSKGNPAVFINTMRHLFSGALKSFNMKF